jgi:cytoskeletal protein CcmA (bactofilin family)
MFRRTTSSVDSASSTAAVERITSVLGPGIIWHGSVSGSGGVRIEGAFEGEIALRGLLVVGETGRVTCNNVRANSVIVAGAVRGNITTQKLEIRSSGRVWGDVTTTAFVTDEGAFLRGQIRMEESVDLGLEPEQPSVPAPEELVPAAESSPPPEPQVKATGGTTVVRRRKSAAQDTRP